MAKKKGNAIRPVGAKILVKRVSAEEKTQGGIIIPDSSQEKPLEGEVVAVGNGRTLDNGAVLKPDVAVGDRVVFGKYAGSELKLDGEELLILTEADLLGVRL